jgi:hypothetical protein
MAKNRKYKVLNPNRNARKTSSADRQSIAKVWAPLFGQIAVICLFVFTANHLLDFVRTHQLNKHEYKLDKNSVSLDLPDWINSSKNLNLDFSKILYERTVFDPNVSEEIKQKFETSSLVAEVSSVSCALPNDISVSLKLRKPMVKIMAGDNAYFMDKDGYVLSPALYNEDKLFSDGRTLPLITSLSHNDLKVGALHPSKSVRSVLSLLMLWDQKDFNELDILEISCKGLDRHSRGDSPDYVVYISNQNKTLKLFFDRGHRRGEINLSSAMDNLQRIVSYNQDLSRINSYVDLRWKVPSIY